MCVCVCIYIYNVHLKKSFSLIDAKTKETAFADVTSHQPFWFMVLLLTAAFFLVLALGKLIHLPSVLDEDV